MPILSAAQSGYYEISTDGPRPTGSCSSRTCRPRSSGRRLPSPCRGEAMPSPVSEAKSARWYNSAEFRHDDPWHGLEPDKTAVVLIDMINWQAHRDGSSVLGLLEVGSEDKYRYFTDRCEQLVVPALIEVLRTARAVGVTVVHARLASDRPDFARIVPAFQPYMTLSEAIEGTWATRVLEELGPAEADVSVVKFGSGAFVSSNLHDVLSA